MTITEAKKRCEELGEQMDAVEKKYLMGDGTLVRMFKEKEMKPLYSEWNKLATAITKAENETNIEE